MILADTILRWISKIAAPPPRPDRPMSTPEEVRWQRRQLEALKREADMLGVDTSFDQASRP